MYPIIYYLLIYLLLKYSTYVHITYVSTSYGYIYIYTLRILFKSTFS